MTERTRMRPSRPDTPTGNIHAPLTIKSISTPFLPASINAFTKASSVSEFILAIILAGLPLAAALPAA